MQRARLAEWVGAPAYWPLPEAPPGLPPVPELDELQSRLASHPVMRSAAATLTARTADVRRADERSKPGWALDVGYGYREGLQPSGEPRSDLVTVGVTLDLPWFSRRSVDATLMSALAERGAAEAGLERERRRLAADLAAEHARWRELGKRLDLFDERILRQSAAAAEAAMNAYRTDAADFADVMRARIDDLEAHTDVLRLELERALSQVRLASLGGL
jgi:outer membrane protein TolC